MSELCSDPYDLTPRIAELEHRIDALKGLLDGIVTALEFHGASIESIDKIIRLVVNQCGLAGVERQRHTVDL